MENQEILRDVLIRLHREFPNNMEFGKKVRELVWQMMEKRSKEIRDEDLSGQINIFGEVKK